MELAELWAIFGPGVAGAVFGAGWCFWVDAVVCSSVKVSFLRYLPGKPLFHLLSHSNIRVLIRIDGLGIFASLAALMFNCVRREDIDYPPYEEGEWRLKLWLFLYVVSFVSLAASVGLLIQDALVESGPSAWTGTAGVFQCVFVLISKFPIGACIHITLDNVVSTLILFAAVGCFIGLLTPSKLITNQDVGK